MTSTSAAPKYDNLIEEAGPDAEADPESQEEEDVTPDADDGPAAALRALCCCCCCCLGFFFVLMMGAQLFAPPEPRENPVNVIWEPVLPSNFSGCTIDYALLWEKQIVHPPGVNCEEPGELLGEWRQGWSFFSMYFYYVQTTTVGEETMIHAQSAFQFFGAQWRLWRGDTADGPVITLTQDYWAQPWFSYEKVRIFDVFQDSLHVARMTETVAPAWVGYGGATVDFFPPAAGELAGERAGLLATMTQPGVFWLAYFQPPAWEVQNFAPQDLPSAVPGFYSLYSDIMEQEQATGPVFWIIVICWCFLQTQQKTN